MDKKLDLSVVRRFVSMHGDKDTMVDKFKDKDGKWVFVVAGMKRDDRVAMIENLELHGYKFEFRMFDGELSLTNI